MSLVIAIDYDDTYTADPGLWSRFIGMSRERGHSVVCVTARTMLPDFTSEPPLPGYVPIVLAGGTLKRAAARDAGYKVDIWIDDRPEMIGGAAQELPFGNLGRIMVVCPKCGNKRCPHANDTIYECTGSNEPGQPGSAYP